MHLRAFLYLVMSLWFFPVFSQNSKKSIDLHPPLKGSLFLSGAFGEIRTDHFHSGVDFRTGGKNNVAIFSCEKGFVSRIKISGTGFGKALYIDHPNGYTTVYAHLDRFSDIIEQFIKDEQYQQEQFEVDVYLKPNQIRVERGEQVAWSGNTGSSGGPHLHFEVRRTANQIPINLSFSNIPIVDVIKPSVRGLWIFQLDSSISTIINNRIPVKLNASEGNIVVSDTLEVFGTIGLALKAYDFINEGSIRCGINGISLTVNGTPWYSFQINEFQFSETRFANSHIDYELRQLEGKRIHKLFIDPNNGFSSYGTIRNKGRISTKTDSLYRVKIAVLDSYGNQTTVSLTLKGTLPKPQFIVPSNGIKTELVANWNFFEANSYRSEGLIVEVPENALYNNLPFTFNVSGKPKGSYSRVYQIANRLVPLHKPYKLSIKPDSLPEKYRSKVLLATFNPKGDIEAAGGNWDKGYVVANLRNFGDYFVSIDTIPPSIKPINIANGKRITNEKEIRFTVEDNFSGIQSIRGTINGKWALFEHDPKNKLVFYIIDKERIGSTGNFFLELKVTDQKGNSSVYKCKFVI